MRASSLEVIQKYWVWFVLALWAVQIGVEMAMGRPWVGESGTIKLWTNDGITGESSQHIADWYTLSHIIHGMLFYGMIWLVCRWRKWVMVPAMALLVAMGIEIAWEFFENSAYVIEHYRTGTAAVDYAGDTIVNSAFDTVWMVLGFAMALKLPVKWVVVLAIGFELLAGWAVRDNLTLNVLTFIWPIQAVVDWQDGA